MQGKVIPLPKYDSMKVYITSGGRVPPLPRTEMSGEFHILGGIPHFIGWEGSRVVLDSSLKILCWESNYKLLSHVLLL